MQGRLRDLGTALHDRQGILAGAAALIGGALLGALTTYSMQAACAVVLVVGVSAIWVWSRPAGVASLWLLWLVAPGIRRVFGYLDSYLEADPLSLAPFVATGAVGLLEFLRTNITPRARRVLAVALLGLCFGVPAAFADPVAGLFGLAAYGSAVGCFLVGYAERAEGARDFTLLRVLIVTAPLLALYGIIQYFLPLPAWDERWIDTVDLASIGAPEDDHIRVFASLNSPGALAAVLALALVFLIARRRFSLGAAILTALIMFAFALTYVRSAFLALVVGLVGLAVATRGRATPRVVAVIGACILAVVPLSGVSSTAAAILDRAATLGDLGDEDSAQERVETSTRVLPDAITAPLGHGLGSAGEATKLRASGGERVLDNGYLALLWQLGPAGFLLMIGAALGALGATLRARAAGADRLQTKGVLVAVLVLLFVLALGGDVFYGVTGAMLWYLLGKAVWLADDVQSAHRARSDDEAPLALERQPVGSPAAGRSEVLPA